MKKENIVLIYDFFEECGIKDDMMEYYNKRMVKDLKKAKSVYEFFELIDDSQLGHIIDLYTELGTDENYIRFIRLVSVLYIIKLINERPNLIENKKNYLELAEDALNDYINNTSMPQQNKALIKYAKETINKN